MSNNTCSWVHGDGKRCGEPTRWKMVDDDDQNSRRKHFHLCASHAESRMAQVDYLLQMYAEGKVTPDMVDDYESEEELKEEKIKLQEIIDRG